MLMKKTNINKIVSLIYQNIFRIFPQKMPDRQWNLIKISKKTFMKKKNKIKKLSNLNL